MSEVNTSRGLKFYVLFLFVTPFSIFNDYELRYQGAFALNLVLAISLLILLMFKERRSLTREGLKFLIWVLFVLSYILFCALFAGGEGNFPASFSDFSDVFIIIAIVVYFLLGSILARYGYTLGFFVSVLSYVLFLNLFVLVFEFLSPVFIGGPFVEFVITTYSYSPVSGVDYWRGTGTVGQGNQLGLALIFLYCFFLAIVFVSQSNIKESIFKLFLVVLCIFLSGTKAAIIEMIVATFVLYLLLGRSELSKKIINLAIWAVVSFLIMLVLYHYLNSLYVRGNELLVVARSDPFSGVYLRVQNWCEALRQINTSPFFGLGVSKSFFDSLGTVADSFISLRHPDSSFAYIVSRYGLFGLLFVYCSYFYLGYKLYRRGRRFIGKNKTKYLLSSALLSVVIIYMLAFFMDPIFNNFTYTAWFFMLLGYTFEQNERREYVYDGSAHGARR